MTLFNALKFRYKFIWRLGDFVDFIDKICLRKFRPINALNDWFIERWLKIVLGEDLKTAIKKGIKL